MRETITKHSNSGKYGYLGKMYACWKLAPCLETRGCVSSLSRPCYDSIAQAKLTTGVLIFMGGLCTLRKSFLLNGISFVVRSFVRSFVRSLVSALSFCTVLLYSSVVRTCAVDKKADHGHKKGHAPRALHGARSHGHLKAAKRGVRCSAPN